MRAMSDAQVTTLETIRLLAGNSGDVDAAFREAAEWAGATERRPPTLSEIFGFLIERRREDGEPTLRPWPEPAPGLATRLAKDPYGFFGRLPSRKRWPFDLIRSPLEGTNDGPILRLYIALALRATNSWRLAPAFWVLLITTLRVLLGLLVCVAAAMFTDEPIAGGIAAGLFGFWFVFSSPYVGERVRRASAVVECNYALVEAEARFGGGMMAVFAGDAAA